MAKKVNINLPKLSGLGVEFQLDGDWASVEKLIGGLRENVQRSYDNQIQDTAESILKIVRRCLYTGTPPKGVTWDPLSASYVKRFGPHPTYNLTGYYARAIGLRVYKSRTLIGIPHGTRLASQGKITLNKLAILLEYGSKDDTGMIPPRPVWAPSFQQYGGAARLETELVKGIQDRIVSNTPTRFK